MRKTVYIPLLLFFLGCTKATQISVQHYVEGKNERASVFVGSPDPERGQLPEEKFLIQWHLTREPKGNEVLELELLYGDLTNEKVRKPISAKQGIYVHRLSKQKIIDKSGILTYRALLYSGNKKEAEWEDLLWFSLITKE